MQDAQTWILLRGLIRGCFHWHVFPEKLQQLRPKDRIICIDIPGNGDRFKESTPWSIQNIAKDIQQEIHQLKIETPVHLISISMGAMVATKLAETIQQNCTSLHLINTSFSNLNPPWHRMRIGAVAGLLPNLFSIKKREQAILKWTSNQEDINPYIHSWITEAYRTPLTLKNATAQLLGAARYKAPLSAPVKNSFVYGSAQDRLVSHRCSTSLANAWQVPIATHPTAGHDLPLDEPDWLLEKILGNIEALENGKASL